MFHLNNTFLTICTLFILFLPGSSHAENKKTAKEPIDIKAEYLLIDENKGISKYKGNVIFTQGTLIIKADSVILYSNGEKLTKAFITGSPADIQHQPEGEPKVHSQAKNIDYFVNKEKLILRGDAFVNQGDKHFSGEKIEYNTRQKIVTASGNKTEHTETSKTSEKSAPSGRVHVIIGPEAEKNIQE